VIFAHVSGWQAPQHIQSTKGPSRTRSTTIARSMVEQNSGSKSDLRSWILNSHQNRQWKGVKSPAMSDKRHLLGRAVGTTLIFLTFGAFAIYVSHHARGRPQIGTRLNQPHMTALTSAPLSSQPPPKAIHTPNGLAIERGVADNQFSGDNGSRPPRPLALSSAQVQSVTDGMRRFAGQHVEIYMGENLTSEDIAFGDALEVALLNADVFVTRNIATAATISNDMNSPSGISILVGKNRVAKDLAPNALALLLINNRVVDGLIPAFMSEKDPDRFAILVTGSSH